MRLITCCLALALTVACDSSTDDDKSTPSDSDTQSTDTDSSDTEASDVEEDDADGDGFTEDRGDCDDDNDQIHPAATDICDEIDNDCDDLVDEFYDRDEDGYLDAEDCEHGDDCDDYDDEVNPGAEEVAYDGEDQDCDGSDLNDVDGDGYAAEEVGGEDCDDNDTGINPGQEDIPKDGIDQDCSGKDNGDGDGDGYDDEDYGGEDCDDEDDEVHPQRYDWWGDEVDSDCDNRDSREMDLGDALVTMEGSAGSQEWVGWQSVGCDLDEDGYDELVMSANLGASYMGEVAIFHGSAAPTWSTGMLFEAADTLITGTEGSLGTALVCDDFNGDGHMDLAIAQSDVACGTTLTNGGAVHLFYGDGGGFDAELDDSDADARFDYDRTATLNGCVIIETPVFSHDFDGDGASELVFNFQYSTSLSDETIGAFVLPGGTHSGTEDLVDEAVYLQMNNNAYGLVAVPDIDGDGVDDLAVGQPFWYDTGDVDTGDTGEYYQGRIGLLSTVLDDDSTFDESVISWYRGSEIGNHVGLGYSLSLIDVDGDGTEELASGAAYHPSADEDLIAGALYLFADYDDLGESAVDADGEAIAQLLGQDESGLMGQAMWTVEDMNGDGVSDLLVWEENENSSGDDNGMIWLFDGAGLATVDAETDYEDVVLLAWDAEGSGYQTGRTVGTGDFDGDGVLDLVIGAFRYGSTSTPGKAYVYLSSDWL